MRVAVAVGLLCACGRVEFVPLTDAPPDAAPPIHCNWSAGPKVGTPIAHGELESSVFEGDAQLVPGDPLTLHFASTRAGTFDTYRATRPAIGAAFDTLVSVPGLASGTIDEYGYQLSASGSAYVVISEGAGARIWEVRSNGETVERVRRLTELPDVTQLDPLPTADGYTLYFTLDFGGNQDIYSATRKTFDEPWGNITPFVHNTTQGDGGLTTTDDHLVIAWTREPDIYFATRDDVAAPFGPATRLDAISTTSELDYEPSLRSDGCELFFSRFMGPGFNARLYSVAIEP